MERDSEIVRRDIAAINRRNVLSIIEREKTVRENREIELADLFKAMYSGKWIIIAFTSFVSLASVAIVLNMPNIYRAEIVVSPATSSGSAGLAGMASQLGGLASITGISLGGGDSDNTNIALATLRSRQLLTSFIRKHQLEIPLLAVEGWDEQSDTLIVDPESYVEGEQQWNPERRPETAGNPTDWELYKAFTKLLTLDHDKKTGLITISISYFDPKVAQQWATWLVADLNQWMKEKKVLEAENNILYMEKQLEKTSIAEMQKIFYQLIEEQTKDLMLASVNEEFSFKIIDPAVIPEEKDQPKRSVIVAISFMLAFILSTLVVLIRYVNRQKNLREVELEK